jgi:uncharacterized delta-60 repeat protein
MQNYSFVLERPRKLGKTRCPHTQQLFASPTIQKPPLPKNNEFQAYPALILLCKPTLTSMKKIVLFIILVLLQLIVLSAVAQDGTLDPSFSLDGKVITSIGSADDFCQAAALQSDGKIVLAGFSVVSGTNADFAMVRFDADGTIDNTFGSGGKVTLDFMGDDDRCSAIAIQPDGKILLAGYCFNGAELDFALARFNSDGSPDNSFSSDGKVSIDFSNSIDRANSIVLQNDGKILLAGLSNLSGTLDFAMLRFNTNGTLDNTFDADGRMLSDFAGREEYAMAIALQMDGKIVVAGASADSIGTDNAVARYLTDGSIDLSFGTGGYVITDLGTVYDENYAVAIQTDGKIITAGPNHNVTSSDFSLVRYNSDGSLDASFDSDGIVFTVIGSSDDVSNTIALQPDGKILVGGTHFFSWDGDFVIYRYNTDGSLDNTFDTDGITTSDMGSLQDEGHVVLIQPDGRILVAGATINADYDFAVARYNGSSVSTAIHENISAAGFSVYPNPAKGSFVISCASQGKCVIVNSIGQTVKEIEMNGADQTISGLENGLYFIGINGSSHSGTVVVSD